MYTSLTPCVDGCAVSRILELKEKEKDSVFSGICSASKLEDSEKVYLQAERMEQKPGEEQR